jgi:hypothetical protein
MHTSIRSFLRPSRVRMSGCGGTGDPPIHPSPRVRPPLSTTLHILYFSEHLLPNPRRTCIHPFHTARWDAPAVSRRSNRKTLKTDPFRERVCSHRDLVPRCGETDKRAPAPRPPSRRPVTLRSRRHVTPATNGREEGRKVSIHDRFDHHMVRYVVLDGNYG